jgi:hypothetical protein
VNPCIFITPIVSGGEESIDIVASRTSGVAPLSVFFDATGTTGLYDTEFFEADDDAVNGSYMDATFYWDFDTTNVDATIDHKYASGFVTTCVFKEPGTYTVQLKVYDNTGYIGYKNITITVSEFSGTTYYVADDIGDDEANGTTIATPFKTPEHALSFIGANVRILFKNGNTFTISSAVGRSAITGPAIISGYSDPSDPSSDKPIIHSTAQDTDYVTMYFNGCSDIRIMNIAATATAESSSPRSPSGIYWNANCNNMLKYNTEEYNLGGLSMGANGQYGAIAECIFHDVTSTGWTSAEEGTADGGAIIGNYVYNKSNVDSNTQHVYRLQGGTRYFFGFNRFEGDIIVSEDALTIRGNSSKIVIYKNRIKGWVQTISPQNRNSSLEYQHHCIIDSNLIIGQRLYSGDSQVAIMLDSKDIVVRNNIIYDYEFPVGILNDSVVGYARRIRAYNNTMIKTTADTLAFNPFYIDTNCTGIFLRNNIMLDIGGSNSPLAFLDIRNGTMLDIDSDYNMFYGSSWGTPNLFDGNTLEAWQTSTSNDLHSSISNPEISDTTPTYGSTTFAKLSSEKIGAKLEYNALDFYGNLRGTVHDIGACDYE